MFRFVLFVVFAVMVVLFVFTLHVNVFTALVFLALGGSLTSTAENHVGYNFIDFLKDHVLSFFGWFQSFSHAKIATLRVRAAKIAVNIEAEEKKIDAALRRRL